MRLLFFLITIIIIFFLLFYVHFIFRSYTQFLDLPFSLLFFLFHVTFISFLPFLLFFYLHPSHSPIFFFTHIFTPFFPTCLLSLTSLHLPLLFTFSSLPPSAPILPFYLSPPFSPSPLRLTKEFQAYKRHYWRNRQACIAEGPDEEKGQERKRREGKGCIKKGRIREKKGNR